jgi:hypothetical protein
VTPRRNLGDPFEKDEVEDVTKAFDLTIGVMMHIFEYAVNLCQRADHTAAANSLSTTERRTLYDSFCRYRRLLLRGAATESVPLLRCAVCSFERDDPWAMRKYCVMREIGVKLMHDFEIARL